MTPYLYPIGLGVISLPFVLLERLRPWRRNQVQLRRSLPTDLLYLVFNAHFLGAILFTISDRRLLPALASALAPLAPLVLLPRDLVAHWPLWAQIPLALVAVDFLEWCIHNLLHRVPALWELHKTHHGVVDGEMDWIVSFRFHWAEAAVYKTLKYVPLLVLGFRPEAAMVHALFGSFMGHLNHSNLDVGRGPWRYLLNSPRMHVWHHDAEPGAASLKNFGIIFSAWDWIFGTAKMDAAGPAHLGFAGVEAFPRNVLAQAAWPLGRLLGAGRAGRAIAALSGAILLATGAVLTWVPTPALRADAEPSRTEGTPMFGERGAASQPALARSFAYARTAAEADAALSSFGEQARRTGYAHPEDLVSASELAHALSARRLVLFDVRPKERFVAGHIPSARNVFRPDYSEEAPIPGLSKDRAGLEELLDAEGVEPDTTLVLYGDGGPEPFRLWWTLRAVGAYSARILDGGLVAWKGAGHALAEGLPKPAARGSVTLSGPAQKPLLTWADLAPVRASTAAQIVDTRSAREYSGEARHPEAARAGRIPGSIHMDWVEVLAGPEDPRLGAPDALRHAFESHRIALRGPLILVCQSGTRSAAAYFALHQLGLSDAELANYNGSWAEYSRLDLPIEPAPH
jgi:3-mercaptopyruvate sulfurtransferase SseA/sterol desaturase/sphingolipid hydroxylase (fatty acid hydroxylase superfamily)